MKDSQPIPVRDTILASGRLFCCQTTVMPANGP
jgi:hypothetical protein